MTYENYDIHVMPNNNNISNNNNNNNNTNISFNKLPQ